LRPQPRASTVARAKRDRAEARSRVDERDDLLALDPRAALRTIGSGTGAGVVPNTLLVGLAALTGDIPFAAPGPGRRVRLARELTPRSRDLSPIDNPG
jgi:hypothetical protein